MKTQYYLMMEEPKENLFYLKGTENGASYTIFPETIRKRTKGFMSLKAAQHALKEWHVGILKISDKGIERI